MQPEVDRSRPIPPTVSLSPYTASFKERLSTIQTQGVESACSTLTTGVSSRHVLHGDSLLKIPGESKGQPPPDCSPLDKDNFKLLLMYWYVFTYIQYVDMICMHVHIVVPTYVCMYHIHTLLLDTCMCMYSIAVRRSLGIHSCWKVSSLIQRKNSMFTCRNSPGWKTHMSTSPQLQYSNPHPIQL